MADLKGLRESLAGFEQLAREQAHLRPEERVRLEGPDGVVIDAVAVSIVWVKRLIAKAEAEEN